MKSRLESPRTTERESLFGDGKFALGFFACALLSVFLLLLLAGRNILSQDQIIAVFPSFVALGVAFLSLVLSRQSLLEQRKIRQAGTDPVILVHLGKREDSPILSTLEISNVGAGAALNVSVTFLTDISEFVPDRIITNFMEKRFPIRTIRQGHSISFNFGLGFKLLEEPTIPPIEVDVVYEDIEGTKYSSRQIIDVRELKGQRADTPTLPKIRSEIESMRRAIERHGAPSNPMNVIIVNREERLNDHGTDRERLKELFEGAKEKE